MEILIEDTLSYKAELTSSSIEKISNSKHVEQCLGEYIWNGFDAGATIVEIITYKNQLGGIDLIKICDNGYGINNKTLDKTFKRVLDSEKITKSQNDNIHGSKGRGRFAFINFAEAIEWKTVINQGDKKNLYTISMNKNSAHEFSVTNLQETEEEIGTEVIISGINPLKKLNPESKEFHKYLNKEFASFLYLNKDKEYKILINGSEFDYMQSIDSNFSEVREKIIGDTKFEIHIIKWNGKIQEAYYFYFRNSQNVQVCKRHTSFNKNSIEFPHSIYIKSKYFDDFEEITGNNTSSLLSKFNQKSEIYKKLVAYLIDVLKEKIREYIKEKAPSKIKSLEKNGAFPEFSENNKYDQMRKEDLKDVLTEIYVIEPKILDGNIKQQKTVVGFLNLLLESDEREGILNIMANINSLSSQERQKLNELLQKTTLNRIIKVVSLLEDRHKVIETLKTLVYDNTKFTNERDHIQKIVEDNYWMFGEKYSLVSADITFEKALKKYVHILDGEEKSDDTLLSAHSEKNRRPDIFMCRSRTLTYESATENEENIIVELKAPSVTLNKKIFRQIEDYMDLISTTEFNSSYRSWKFIMVSKEIDEYIKTQYNVFKDKGKRFLVKASENFEIYAMTWDDVFKSFEISNSYILDKLNFDKEQLKQDIVNMSDASKRVLANELVERLSELETK